MSFLGARMRAIRQQRRMTQAAFADLVGVTQATVSRWESGSQTPNGLDHQRIVGVLPELRGDPQITLALIIQESVNAIALYTADYLQLAASKPFLEIHGAPGKELSVGIGRRQLFLFDRLINLLDHPSDFFGGTVFAIEHLGRLGAGFPTWGTSGNYHRTRILPYSPTPDRPLIILESEIIPEVDAPAFGDVVDVIFRDLTRKRLFPGPSDEALVYEGPVDWA